MEKMEGELSQAERRDRDRMIALRGIIKESMARVGIPAASVDVDDFMVKLDAAHNTFDEDAKNWDSYRNSFTLLMSKGYVQTVEQLRDKLLATEWEIGLRPIAMQMWGLYYYYKYQCLFLFLSISIFIYIFILRTAVY